MLLCFVVKNSYLIQEHHRHGTTHSLRISANNNSLKHPSPQSQQSSKWQQAISFLCKEWIMELLSLRTFVPRDESSMGWNFRPRELSFPGTNVPWNFRFMEHSSPGTFVPLDRNSWRICYHQCTYWHIESHV